MRERIAAALKTAVAEGDQPRVATLRLLLATLKDREQTIADGEDQHDDDEPAVQAILATMVKQREESIRDYEEGGRLELAAREQAEIDVIRGFMPKPMTEAEVTAAVSAAIAETDAASIKDMGRVIDALKARHAGRMDFGRIGARVKAALD